MKHIDFSPLFFLIISLFLLLLTVFGSSAIAQAPQYGGTLVASTEADVTTLNPVWKYDVAAYYTSQNIYSTLVISDFGVTVGKGPYGDLAKSWDVSPDGLTYTFHLHDNVYWHDGVKFSSDDVKFTYETAIAKKYPISAYLRLVKEILTPDKNTIVFKLSSFNAAFLPMLAQASNWYGQIIAKHLYEGTDIPNNPYNKKPVGTGPFKFEEWQPGFVSLKANEKYFRGRPYLDKVTWRLYATKEVAQVDFRGGSLDLLAYTLMPPAQEIKAAAARPGVKLLKQLSQYAHDIRFNHMRKPFSDIRVREAISLAIDRDEVSAIAWGDLLGPNYHASCIGTPDFTDVNIRWPKQDLKRAGQLLDEAGYPAGPDGVRMKLTTVATGYYKEFTEVIIEQLKKIGIQVNLNLVDQATWFSRLTSGDFDLAAYYDRFGPDPDAYREHFGTKGARNYGKYSNATADQLLEDGINTFDFTKRKRVYDKVQEILQKDFAFLPVTEHGYWDFCRSKFHGTPKGDPTSYGKSMGWSGYGVCWMEK